MKAIPCECCEHFERKDIGFWCKANKMAYTLKHPICARYDSLNYFERYVEKSGQKDEKQLELY